MLQKKLEVTCITLILGLAPIHVKSDDECRPSTNTTGSLRIFDFWMEKLSTPDLECFSSKTFNQIDNQYQLNQTQDSEFRLLLGDAGVVNSFLKQSEIGNELFKTQGLRNRTQSKEPALQGYTIIKDNPK